MPADKGDEIVRLLKSGKTSAEIIGLGYPKGTVYSTQRKWRQSKNRERLQGGKKTRASTKESPVPEAATPLPEVESDPEIAELQREVRKAELRKQLLTLHASSDLEAMSRAAREIGLLKRRSCERWEHEHNICRFWEWPAAADIPEGVGETVLDDEDKWRLRPSPLYCAVCTADLQQQIHDLDDRTKEIPLSHLRVQFACDCGAKGMLAVSVKCTQCGKEAWWGWWPGAG